VILPDTRAPYGRFLSIARMVYTVPGASLAAV